MNLGFPEMVVLFVVALLVFGPKRLPELAQNLGKGIRDFKKAMSGEDEEQAPPTGHAPQIVPPPATEATIAQSKPGDAVASPTADEKAKVSSGS